MLNIFKKNTIFGRNTNSDLPLYYDNITVEGKTEQETRSGKNLLKNTNVNSGDNNYWSGYSTFDEPTRTLTRSTTATTESYISHRLNGLKSNATYTLSLYAKSNGYVRNMDLYCHNQNTQGIKSKQFLTLTTEFVKYTFTFTTASDVTYGANSMIRIDNNGSTTSGTEAILTVKDVMLVEGTDTEYEDYGISPSPDYPSELVSVGYENMYEGSQDFSGTWNNSSYWETDTETYNSLVVKKRKSSWSGISKDLNVESGKTYTFSVYIKSDTARQIALYTSGGTSGITSQINYTTSVEWGKYTLTFTATTSGTIRPRVENTSASDTNYTYICGYQLVEGTQAHSYIPYGKYGIEVKTTGRNLFDIQNATKTSSGLTATIQDGIVSVSGTSTTTSFIMLIQNTFSLKAGTYTISAFNENTYNDNQFDLRITGKDGVGILGRTYLNVANSSTTFTLSEDLEEGCVQIRASSGDTLTNFIVKPQLEKGTQATSYEPYIGHTNLISLGAPLRSIGDTKDLLYIKNGYLYVDRKIGSVVLNGSEAYYYDSENPRFTTFVSGSRTENKRNPILSNYFRYGSSGNSTGIAFNYGGVIYLYNYDYNTTTAFKNWLSTHNTEVQYVLATPVIETYELDVQPMIFDSLGYGTLSDVVSDPLVTEELNGSYILEFEYMKNGKFSEYLVEENIIKAHGEPFSIYSVEKDTDEKIKILAKHWVINEWDKDFILDSAPTDLAAQNALAWIQQRSINHSDISISGDCTATSTARYVRKNMLSAIFKEDNAILTRFGGELSYNKNNVSVNKHRGSLSGLTIRQGKNLTGAKYYLDFSTVTTRLVPVGKDGLMLDEVYVDSPLINNYATPIIRKVEVNTTSKDELRSYCNKLYENGLDKPTVSIKIDFIELSKTDEYKQYSSLETAHLGDEVTAYIPSLNLNVSTRIVKTVYNDNLKRITALELGSITPNIATSSVNVEKNLQKQVEQLAANDLLILDEAKEEASNLIKHPFGGYIYIDETTGNMYIMDTNNINTAQNVWRWGLGGLGFSSTGVNGTYGIAMTQDGKIVADYIKSGTLQSVTIKATNGTVGGYKIGENKLYAETYSSYNFDSSDLTAIRNYLMDEGSLSDDELIKYDIDGNGVVDSRDYVLIRNFIELGVTKNKSAKIIMQTGNNIFENAYILQDANANDILNINFNGFIYDHPNNGKFNLSGSKLTLTDINNNSMTISPNWLPKSVLSNWYSTSSTTLTDAKKHKLLVILGKPTSSSGIVSLIIPTDALSTSNQQFQCADESKYVAFNVRYNNDDVIITGAGRSSDGSILSAWTLL